ncbi:hypothetical protein PSGK_21320 [Pseudomonas solani]
MSIPNPFSTKHHRAQALFVQNLGPLQQKALQINRCTRLGVQFLPEVGEHPFVVPVPSQGHHQVRLKAVVAQTPAGALQEVVGNVAVQLEALLEGTTADIAPEIEAHVSPPVALLDLIVQIDVITRPRAYRVPDYFKVSRAKHIQPPMES